MKPKVSICMPTYNHEKFIAQAIEGVMMQKTDFSFELIVSDDCSADKTRDIILQYKNKFPDKINPLLRGKNYGMMKNLVETLRACEGEYIAWCEGDDYWTDPHKLQTQIDFLENNPDYSISSHNVNVADESSGLTTEWLGKRENETITLEDLLRDGSGGATCSLVFRNKVYGEFPSWYAEQKGGDWTLQILCAEKGKMKYFNQVMGVYRRHANGATTAAINEAKKNNLSTIALPAKYCLETIAVLDDYFKYKYSNLFKKQKRFSYFEIMNGHCAANDFAYAKNYAYKIVFDFWRFPPKKILKILLTAFLPVKVLKNIYNLKNKWKY